MFPDEQGSAPNSAPESNAVQQNSPEIDPAKYGDDQIAEATTAAAPKTYKLKINGQEQEVPVEKLIERYQKEEAADEKFKSAAQMRKEAEELKRQYAEIDKNPFEFARKKGIDIHQLAEDILIEKLRWEKATPEQRELALAKQREIEYEERLKEYTAKEEADKFSQAEATAAKQIDDEIGEALGELGCKPTPAIVANIATTLLSYHEAGREVSTKEVVRRVRENLRANAQELVSSMPIDELKTFLPKSVLDGLRKASVESALAQDPMRSRKKPEQQEQNVSSSKPVSTDDFFKQMDEKYKRR